MSWADFCLSLQESAQRQEREVKRAIHQMGELRLSPEFKHLEVKAETWARMTSPQREAHFKGCFSKPLDILGKYDVEEAACAEESLNTLSVSPEKCGITQLCQGVTSSRRGVLPPRS